MKEPKVAWEGSRMKCWLNEEPFKQCCCNCLNHRRLYYKNTFNYYMISDSYSWACVLPYDSEEDLGYISLGQNIVRGVSVIRQKGKGSKMGWSKEIPKVPGYYWCKPTGSLMSLWIVKIVSTVDGLLVEDWRCWRLLNNNSQAYKWYGPLKPPQEKALWKHEKWRKKVILKREEVNE